MEGFRDMKMSSVVRFAEYIAEHAEDFPQCLPLLKEAFQALSTAERKIECLKQSFIKHWEENRGKSSEPASEEYDGNSTVVSMCSATEYFTETEELPPTKKKKISSVVDQSDNDANAGPLESHQPVRGLSDISSEHSTPKIKRKKKKKIKLIENTVDEEVKSISPRLCVSPVDTKEELKVEEADENKEELLLNTVCSNVYQRDPLLPERASSETPTETSVSSRVSSMSPRKRKKSICINENSEYPSVQMPTCTDHELLPQAIFSTSEPGSYIPISAMPPASNRTGSPCLRVIPSALLMENPEQLDVQPAGTNISLSTSHVQIDRPSIPHGQGAVEPGHSETKNRSVLYFEFSRDVDKRKWLEISDVIMAIKRKDSTLAGCWITVENMRRSNNIVSGYLIFPNIETCLRVRKNGLRVNGFFGRLEPVDTVEGDGSFTDSQPEPVGCASSPSAAFRTLEHASADERIPSLLHLGSERHRYYRFVERCVGWGEGRGGRWGNVRGGGRGDERGGERVGSRGDERGGERGGGRGNERVGGRGGRRGDERGGGRGNERVGGRGGGCGERGGERGECGGGRGSRQGRGHGGERGGGRNVCHRGGRRGRRDPSPRLG